MIHVFYLLLIALLAYMVWYNRNEFLFEVQTTAGLTDSLNQIKDDYIDLERKSFLEVTQAQTKIAELKHDLRTIRPKYRTLKECVEHYAMVQNWESNKAGELKYYPHKNGNEVAQYTLDIINARTDVGEN